MEFAMSSPVRTLQPGEIIELLHGPLQEKSIGATRIQGRALRDGVTGWASVTGAGSAALLEATTPFLKVTSSVPLNPASVAPPGAAPLRSLAEGELLEVLSWERPGDATQQVQVK